MASDGQAKHFYGGVMEDDVGLAKKGFGLDPKKKGTFTKYCKGKGYSGPTNECIDKGLASKNVTTRRRAQFAKNAKHKFKKQK